MSPGGRNGGGATAADDSGRSREEAEAALARLREAQAELVSSARLATLGTMVAGIAHELNTPLGALNSNHDVLRRSLEHLQEILADERVDEDELDQVRRIVSAVDGIIRTNNMAVDRMVSLVKSLRSFGRPDRAEVDRVDLHEGIDSTLEILRHELRDGIRVVKDYGELPEVKCYPNQLNQVFMNLLLNAIQALPDGEGTIEIRTRARDGERVSIRVRDDGVGIPEEDRRRIFEPGFTTKGGGSGDSSRMGMGLGLLICHQVVDRHGGEIEVESEPGEGTAFTVRIPTELPEETG